MSSSCSHCQTVNELANEIVKFFYEFVRVYTQVHDHDGDLTCRELLLLDDLVDLEFEVLEEPLL